MYQLELLKNSPKGANSIVFDKATSDKPTALFYYAYCKEEQLFPCKPELMEYVAEAIEEISPDYKGKSKLINKIIKLNDEFDNTNDEETWEKRNNLILDLIQNEQVCLKVMDVLNYENIGINFKKVSD